MKKITRQKNYKNNKAARKDQIRAKNKNPKETKNQKSEKKTLKANFFSDAMLSLSCFFR